MAGRKPQAEQDRDWRAFEVLWLECFEVDVPRQPDKHQAWERFVNTHEMGVIEPCLQKYALEHPGKCPTIGAIAAAYKELTRKAKEAKTQNRPPVPPPCNRCSDTGWAWVVLSVLRDKRYLYLGKTLRGGRLEVGQYPCASDECGKGLYRMAELFGHLEWEAYTKAYQTWAKSDEWQYASREAAEAALADIERRSVA